MADYSNLCAVLIVSFSISSDCLNVMIGLFYTCFKAVKVVIRMFRENPTDLPKCCLLVIVISNA